MPFKDLVVPKKTIYKRNGRDILERDVESVYAAKKMKQYSISFEKFTSPSKRSVPDRLCGTVSNFHWPAGFIFFIEFKRPGKKATNAQRLDHARRRAKGHVVFVVDSYEEFDIMLDIVAHIFTTGKVPELPKFLLT
jgi:hypothetical protein